MLNARGEKLDSVVQLLIDDQLLISRITGRLIHAPSGRTYHKTFRYTFPLLFYVAYIYPRSLSPPKKQGVDDVTGEQLIQRSDDNVETLTKRLASFHAQTGPVVDYYKAKGLWHGIDASQSPKVVWDNMRSIFVSKKN
jgi:adenylate kinase